MFSKSKQLLPVPPGFRGNPAEPQTRQATLRYVALHTYSHTYVCMRGSKTRVLRRREELRLRERERESLRAAHHSRINSPLPVPLLPLASRARRIQSLMRLYERPARSGTVTNGSYEARPARFRKIQTVGRLVAIALHLSSSSRRGKVRMSLFFSWEGSMKSSCLAWRKNLTRVSDGRRRGSYDFLSGFPAGIRGVSVTRRVSTVTGASEMVENLRAIELSRADLR